MYKIIGTDGKEYGPATADQIRQWIRAYRVERQTPIFTQGAADWTFVGLLPEFAHDFPGTTPPPIATPAPATTPPPAPAAAFRHNSMAKAGLIWGILSITFICCCGGFPFNILGLIFSIIALVQISENPQRYGGRDMAIIGLVFSTIGFLFLLLMLIVK